MNLFPPANRTPPSFLAISIWVRTFSKCCCETKAPIFEDFSNASNCFNFDKEKIDDENIKVEIISKIEDL